MAEWQLLFSFKKDVSDIARFSEIIKEMLMLNKIKYQIWILYVQLVV